jgi:hypothetical protein
MKGYALAPQSVASAPYSPPQMIVVARGTR